MNICYIVWNFPIERFLYYVRSNIVDFKMILHIKDNFLACKGWGWCPGSEDRCQNWSCDWVEKKIVFKWCNTSKVSVDSFYSFIWCSSWYKSMKYLLLWFYAGESSWSAPKQVEFSILFLRFNHRSIDIKDTRV